MIEIDILVLNNHKHGSTYSFHCSGSATFELHFLVYSCFLSFFLGPI